MSEPGGRFLRQNQPAEDLWYSRDVAAIAVKRRLGRVAPFFIDAEAAGQGYPIGGMTVVRFRNTHLVYALTWFALAALAAFGAWRVYRDKAAPCPESPR
jgi:surfeit locus 1 family protein